MNSSQESAFTSVLKQKNVSVILIYECISNYYYMLAVWLVLWDLGSCHFCFPLAAFNSLRTKSQRIHSSIHPLSQIYLILDLHNLDLYIFRCMKALLVCLLFILINLMNKINKFEVVFKISNSFEHIFKHDRISHTLLLCSVLFLLNSKSHQSRACS